MTRRKYLTGMPSVGQRSPGHAAWRSAGWVAIGLLVCSSGCACSPSPPTTGLAPSTAELWLLMIEEGRTDEATTLLLQNPGMLDAINAPEAFSISETDFAWLTLSRREVVMEQALHAITQIRTLARAMLEKADQLQREGQGEEARSYREAVQNLGQSLNSPERLLIFQQTGSALSSAAQEPTMP